MHALNKSLSFGAEMSSNTIDITLKILTLLVQTIGFLATILTLLMYHKRARREFAVKLMLDWSNDNDMVTKACVEDLVDLIPEETVRRIWGKESVEIEYRHLAFIEELLGDRYENSQAITEYQSKPQGVTPPIIISELHSRYIEYHWTKYLNRLESILVAWSSGVAQGEIMKYEFTGTLALRKGIITTLIKTDPSNKDPQKQCFPAIQAFLDTTKVTFRP
jgi:hypothetical protein